MTTRTFQHQRVEVVRGERSGATFVVAIHSTALGPALGGCRLRSYPSWRDGLADALRLSEAMTYKTSLAGLQNGGGKMVIIQTPPKTQPARTDLFYDAGDLIESLGGEYITGPDMGTSSLDMELIGQRSRHVFCLPENVGGSGDTAADTALGAVESLRTVAHHLYGTSDLGTRRILVVGLGRVGELIARLTGTAGAETFATDTQPARRLTAESLGCHWVDPAQAMSTRIDFLVPAGPGGLLTMANVEKLRCDAIVGPANNQLATDRVAEALHEARIIWAPDYLVGAGGVIGATSRELHSLAAEQTDHIIRRIGQTLKTVLEQAAAEECSPHRVALHMAASRLTGAELTRQ